jgi:hypothetical protein
MALRQAYVGRSTYLTDAHSGSQRMFVAVACHIGDLPDRVDALLDTAAEWCVIRPEQAKLLQLTPSADEARLHTRFGTISGWLERIPIKLLAQEGDVLSVDATCFISDDWLGPVVIGWKGYLERIRFALDPGRDSFYFGDLE